MAQLIQADLALPAWDSPAFANYAVLVDGARIVAAGDATDLNARFPEIEAVPGQGLVLMPAMTDSHDHGRALGTQALGVPDDPLEVWLVGLAEQPRMDAYTAALFDGLRLLRSGVSLVLHSHNLRDVHGVQEEVEATLTGYRDAGIRVAFDMPFSDQKRLSYDEAGLRRRVPAEQWPTRPPALPLATYLDLCAGLVARHHDPDGQMVTVCVGPSGPQWCSDEAMVTMLDFSREHSLRTHVHALETAYQREYGFRQWGCSVIRHLDAIGLLGPWLTLAHGVWLEPDDVPLLAERGVAIAHNPSSNLRLRSGVARLPELLAAGVRLGLGLDGHALDDDQDLFREVRLAWTLANRPGAASPSVPLSAVWRMATTGGAEITLGPNAALGRLETGYLADLVLVERGSGLEDWLLGPAARSNPGGVPPDLAEALFRGASHHHVRHVMVNGAWVVRDGHSTRADECDVAARLARTIRDGARAGSTAHMDLVPYVRDQYATEWTNPD